MGVKLHRGFESRPLRWPLFAPAILVIPYVGVMWLARNPVRAFGYDRDSMAGSPVMGGVIHSSTFLVALALYFLPTIVAVARKVTNQGSVVVINLFLGWTFVGWVVALAMACRTTRVLRD
jgi:hypothetical protein